MPVKFGFGLWNRIFHKHRAKLGLHAFGHKFSRPTDVAFDIDEVIVIAALNGGDAFPVKAGSEKRVEVQIEKSVTVRTDNIILFLSIEFSDKNAAEIQRPDFNAVGYSVQLVEVFVISYNSFFFCIDSDIVIVGFINLYAFIL